MILSLENHCSIKQQQAMAHIMKNTFGSKLFTERLEESPLRLPRPAQYKQRIFIKVCGPNASNEYSSRYVCQMQKWIFIKVIWKQWIFIKFCGSNANELYQYVGQNVNNDIHQSRWGKCKQWIFYQCIWAKCKQWIFIKVCGQTQTTIFNEIYTLCSDVALNK